MLGILGNSVASQGGVDALLHGLVAFGRALLGKAPQVCVSARFDSQLNAVPEFMTELNASSLFNSSLDAAPEFSTSASTTAEFSSIIQVGLVWTECG